MPTMFIKTFTAVTPVPKYEGDDDLEILMKWLQGFLTFIDIHQLVGRNNDYNRVLTIGSALEGRALGWFNLNMRGPLSGPRLTFLDVITSIADEFLTPAAATRAQQSLEKIQYSTTLGIRTYVRELQTLSNHIFMPIDEYTLRKQIIAAIPQTICHWLINYKDLSISTSTAVEWVNTIERRERKLLEREAYNVIVQTAKRTTLSTQRNRTTYATSSARTPSTSNVRFANNARQYTSKTVAAKRTMANATATPRTSDCGMPSGHQVPVRQKVPLAEIVCHACGKKGHYKGSRECPKTPSSARLHTMGTETEMEEPSSAENPETPEDIFDGEEYDGEEDFGPTEEEPETDDVGTGAVIASIHVEEEENDEEVATELMKSIKEDYEVRGSGIKPRPIGKTKGQLKANSTREWASNSNVRTNRPYNSDKQLINRQGLPALVKVNGVEAYTCWDSGSELDAISPDFTRATGIRPKSKENALKIRLGTKGSGATTSYEATPMLEFGKMKLMHKLDVVNLDRWDLLLGSPFCNKYGVVLDYKMRTICFGNTMIKALTEEEEAVVRKKEKRPRRNVAAH